MSALGSDATVWRWAQRATLNHSNQQAAYQHFLPRVRRLSPVNRTWIGIWDVDEFAFGVKQTLLEHLRILPPRVEQVCMLWTVFGSSGHHQQPACVTASNVYRAETSDTIGKCVQRLDRTDSPQVHRSILVNESWYQKRRGACLCPDLQRYCSHDGRFPSMACPMARAPQAFGRWKLRLHHYVSQSHEMMAMKQARGLPSSMRRHKTSLYWFRQELHNNRIEDRALRDHAMAPCAMSASDPSPRPLTRNATHFDWNTWTGLDTQNDAYGCSSSRNCSMWLG